MPRLYLRALLPSLLVASAVQLARADEINCAEVELDSFMTSTGQVGVLLPTGDDGAPEYATVQPGECFYDGALRRLKEMCSGFPDPGSSDPGGGDISIWDEVPQMDDSSTTFTPRFGDAPKANTVRQMRESITKLKRQVRILRRKLYRRGR